MEKYLTLMASFVKRQYYPHLLLTLLFVAVSGGFVSFKGLEEQQAARVMEMYAAFAGILLFPPSLYAGAGQGNLEFGEKQSIARMEIVSAAVFAGAFGMYSDNFAVCCSHGKGRKRV